ncbi:MbcA/ParS/Xre antitoxin family protein [Microbulbifer thermotolerans]|uniref:MbcA/ParS/Xre antitoxin family protein n=1 Tax=Microbulbifer thermotolerans TaxID=252514 RepID=UPI00267163CD|nr:MbcA/ParS/Xre antitoxin family protein [Microbulbifer thermotolerans]WKT59702.1 MbcA/ParS/Xre antitoxin family protein [Microbulbifer thermotolerans]
MSIQKKWEDYANIFLDDFEDSEENKELENIVGDKKIAAAIKFHIGSHYKEWLHSNIDALNGKKPVECIESEEGIKQLKEMLMKIPC